jgi:hypothetical protein
MRTMADAIVQCARLVARAMPLLANIGQHAGSSMRSVCRLPRSKTRTNPNRGLGFSTTGPKRATRWILCAGRNL